MQALAHSLTNRHSHYKLWPSSRQRHRCSLFSLVFSQKVARVKAKTKVREKMMKPSMLRSLHSAATRGASHLSRRGYASEPVPERKVAVLGAAGGIGQPLSLLMKLNPLVSSLSLYDIAGTPGVAADVSHINTGSEVPPIHPFNPLFHFFLSNVEGLLCFLRCPLRDLCKVASFVVFCFLFLVAE